MSINYFLTVILIPRHVKNAFLQCLDLHVEGKLFKSSVVDQVQVSLCSHLCAGLRDRIYKCERSATFLSNNYNLWLEAGG